MGSEDDDKYAYESDYDEDYYDDDEEEIYQDDDDADEHVHGSVNTKKTYTALKECDILKRQEHEISRVSGILSISEAAASKLLCYYRWNVSQLHDEWFADEEKVRDEVGLPSDVVTLSTTKKKATCGICFDVLSIQNFYPIVCGHMYCKECWRRYIEISIDDGPGCLLLRCPEPSCKVSVCRDMIDDLVEEKKTKYSRFFMRLYVEVSKKIKWCPAPGCENAVELELGNEVFDVACLCSCTFCWNCGHDAHRPLKCEIVAKWVLKNESESENTTWILANSKACPKCKRYIEKNKGCMHMTCTSPCKYEFCWLCLGDWKKHSSKTGGYYRCNKYEADKKEGLYDEEESIRKMAKQLVEKYTHYFERWASNQKSRDKAIEDLKEIQTVSLTTLSNKTRETETQLQFITDAWKQIIECRRVLKWTYAYGYYQPEDNHVQKEFFEYTQGEAEANLERLHKCAEEDLKVFLEDKPGIATDTNPIAEADFGKFRQKLVDLTVVTHSYFEKLVTFLESQR